MDKNWHIACFIRAFSITLMTIMHSTAKQQITTQLGFTLIELMIVVTIIGILLAIAIPAYQKYVNEAYSTSCLAEVKGYSTQVYLAINDPKSGFVPITPTLSACQSITDATGWTLNTQQKIIAVAKTPSNARIECDIPNGTPCVVLP